MKLLDSLTWLPLLLLVGSEIAAADIPGTVEITTWDTAITITGHDGSEINAPGASIRANATGTVTAIEFPEGASRANLRIPHSLAVHVDGFKGKIQVRDMSAPVTVKSDHGAVRIANIHGDINVRTFDQPINISRVEGNVQAESLHQMIVLRQINGDITARSVTNGVRVSESVVHSLEMTSTTGILEFDGVVRSGARFAITTHTGEVNLRIRSGSDATVIVGGNLDALSVENGSVTREDGVARVSVGLGRGRVEASAIVGATTVRVDPPD